MYLPCNRKRIKSQRYSQKIVPKKVIHKNPTRTLPTATQIVVIQRTTIRIRTFSIHEEQRPTTSLCHEQKDDRREWNEFILRRPSTSCRTRDGNKMWNCKLCVGRIGPWTVVAVDHASRGPGLKGREPSPIARVDPSLNQERKRERKNRERKGRGGFKCAFERSNNVWARGVSLEGAGNLLRYVGRSLPSEYEERFLWFELQGWRRVVRW